MMIYRSKNMKDNIYIHYGHKKFDKEIFINIRNDNWVKPIGGLWSSDVNAEFGWKDWCKENNFRECRKNNSFKFKLKQNARVLVIDNSTQLNDLPKIDLPYKLSWVTLDFEKIMKEYDAIEVLLSKDWQLYWDLYGWDCDSLIVINPECIEVIKK